MNVFTVKLSGRSMSMLPKDITSMSEAELRLKQAKLARTMLESATPTAAELGNAAPLWPEEVLAHPMLPLLLLEDPAVATVYRVAQCARAMLQRQWAGQCEPSEDWIWDSDDEDEESCVLDEKIDGGVDEEGYMQEIAFHFDTITAVFEEDDANPKWAVEIPHVELDSVDIRELGENYSRLYSQLYSSLPIAGDSSEVFDLMGLLPWTRELFSWKDREV